MRAAGFAVEAEGEAGCWDRGPWLQERGARCSGLSARAPGPERRRRVLLFWIRSLEAFPQGKKAIFSHLLSNLLSRAE